MDKDKKKLEEIVERFRNGESELFDTIYYETQKAVFLTISSIIKKRIDAEDLMQETYMKALNNLSSYKKGTNFLAWIVTIARNTAINYYNLKKREILVDQVEDEYLFPAVNNNDSLLNRTQKILSGNELDIVIYHIVLNLKFKEIAEILLIPLSTVFYLYKQALAKIKKEL